MTTGPCTRTGSPHHPATPSKRRRSLRRWRHGPARRMLRPDVTELVRKPMSTAKVFRAACLALGLALLGASCTGPQQDPSANGVRGGMLQVLSALPISGLDTADIFGPIARPLARTLYGYNLSGPPAQATIPVPDIASGPPQRSADRRTYTFTLRPGVHYAPPV